MCNFIKFIFVHQDETDIDKIDTPAETQVQNETDDKEILEVDPIVDSEKVQTTDSTEKERKVRIRRPKQSSFVKCKNDLRQDMDVIYIFFISVV